MLILLVIYFIRNYINELESLPIKIIIMGNSFMFDLNQNLLLIPILPAIRVFLIELFELIHSIFNNDLGIITSTVESTKSNSLPTTNYASEKPSDTGGIKDNVPMETLSDNLSSGSGIGVGSGDGNIDTNSNTPKSPGKGLDPSNLPGPKPFRQGGLQRDKVFSDVANRINEEIKIINEEIKNPNISKAEREEKEEELESLMDNLRLAETQQMRFLRNRTHTSLENATSTSSTSSKGRTLDESSTSSNKRTK